jgi:DME family drug/metabolite transporter
MRNLVGIMLLWTLVALSKNKRRYQRKDIFPLMLGGIGTAGFMPFYTLGFQRTGVAIASVLAIGAAPIFTGIVGRIVLGRVPSRNWFIGTGLAVIGIVGLNWPSEGTSVQVAGAFFALMAALSYALQATGMEMMGNRLSAVQSVAAIWTVGTVMQAPIVIGRDFTFLTEPILLIGVIYGGIFTCAISFSMFTWGIARIGAPTAVTVGLLEPITTTALGVFVLNEVLTSIGIVGIVFVLAGLVVVSRRDEQSAAHST